MMSDMLRAARIVPRFRAAMDVWLIETSAPLKSAQAAALAGTPLRWAQDIASLPSDLPVILIANEFLDCLPIEQSVRRGDETFQRRVGIDATGALTFVDDAGAVGPHFGAREFDIVECSPALAHFGREVGDMIGRVGGAALFIDYGSADTARGDTLQALREHRKESALAHPGEAGSDGARPFSDLPRGCASWRCANGAAGNPRAISFGGCISSLRAEALARANPQKAALNERQLQRLIAPSQMGELFKVACLHSRDVLPP